MVHVQGIVLHIFSIIVFVSSSPVSTAVSLKRHKRHLFQMCELISHHTNRGCLDFNNYGCFCGLGNAASRHVDGVDGCCRVHDRCFGEVSCFLMFPQVVGYSVNCTGDECRCTDSPIFSPCARTTCECDLQLAQCLGRQRYNYQFSGYDRDQCHQPQRKRRSGGRKRRRRRAVQRAEWNSFVEEMKQLTSNYS